MDLAFRTGSACDLLNSSSHYLELYGVENPRLNAERLLSHAVGLERARLYIDMERTFPEDDLRCFTELLKRRARREPLQYILGETEFMSLPFTVSPEVLIPRPETEVLVEQVVDRCEVIFAGHRNLPILDLGTGSGCIAISLAKYLPSAHVTAVDTSRAALAVAQGNAEKNGVEARIEFIQLDLFSDACSDQLPAFDVIVSNPPYVSTAEYQGLAEEIRMHEPEVAVSDRADGITFYRRIAWLAGRHLNQGGLLAVEFGMGQGPAIQETMAKYGINIELVDDLNGVARVAIGQRSN